ncbi:MAG: hypothetical protein JO295_10905 [Verrucomicrobia bacterium]|nr:hypothetical protein [Verrucomicrobiota bacterium]
MNQATCLCIAIWALLFLVVVVHAVAEIMVSQSWLLTTNAANLVSGAGSDLERQFESAAGNTTLSVTNIPSSGTWRVFARRADGVWNGNFAFYVRRTSSGSGSGTIAGGDSYVEVTNTDTEFFSGTADRNTIAIQSKLSGVSKNLAPNTYTTAVIFTVVPDSLSLSTAHESIAKIPAAGAQPQRTFTEHLIRQRPRRR